MGALHRLVALGLVVLFGAGMTSALAAANAVPVTKHSDTRRPITPNDLKPTECNGITVTTKIVGSGPFNGTNANDLILGSAGADTINGGAGTDCILGGGGNDNLNGQGGADVILGGDGDDDINGGGGADTCYGGPGTDTFANCETQFP